MSEFDIIRQYFSRPQRAGVLGPGDDCALLPSRAGVWAISTDLLLEGRHFFSTVAPAALGHKALAVNLSDLAAMGATPRGFVLGLGLPRVDHHWLEAFSSGLHAIADDYGCPLIGGDTTRSNNDISIAVTVFGEVDARKALRRDAARPGDDIWVSGVLGDADIALRLMQLHNTSVQSGTSAPIQSHGPSLSNKPGPDRTNKRPQTAATASERDALEADACNSNTPAGRTRDSHAHGALWAGTMSHSAATTPWAADDAMVEALPDETDLHEFLAAMSTARAQRLLAQTRARLERPQPRVSLGVQLSGMANAAIDVSDGLLQDLGHVLKASGCGAVIEAHHIPMSSALLGLPYGYALRAALGGGDAYELCFTAPVAMRSRIDALAARLQLPLTRIGVITATRELIVQSAHSGNQANAVSSSTHLSTEHPPVVRRFTNLPDGFDHFSSNND